MVLFQKTNNRALSKRVGSLGDDIITTVLDQQGRLDRVRTQLLDSFEATYKSVREEIAVKNRDNMYLLIANLLGGKQKFLDLFFTVLPELKYVSKGLDIKYLLHDELALSLYLKIFDTIQH